MACIQDSNGHKEGSAKPYSLALHGPDFVPSVDFVLVEFASRDGSDRVLVHPAPVSLLETVRAHFGKPVLINSGYRSPHHNRRIGGLGRYKTFVHVDAEGVNRRWSG